MPRAAQPRLRADLLSHKGGGRSDVQVPRDGREPAVKTQWGPSASAVVVKGLLEGARLAPGEGTREASPGEAGSGSRHKTRVHWG